MNPGPCIATKSSSKSSPTRCRRGQPAQVHVNRMLILGWPNATTESGLRPTATELDMGCETAWVGVGLWIRRCEVLKSFNSQCLFLLIVLNGVDDTPYHLQINFGFASAGLFDTTIAKQMLQNPVWAAQTQVESSGGGYDCWTNPSCLWIHSPPTI